MSFFHSTDAISCKPITTLMAVISTVIFTEIFFLQPIEILDFESFFKSAMVMDVNWCKFHQFQFVTGWDGVDLSSVRLYQLGAEVWFASSFLASVSGFRLYSTSISYFLPPFEFIMDSLALVEDWSKLSLTSIEEDVSVDVDRSAEDRTRQMLGCCLIGKLLSHRFLAVEVMQKTFKAAWRID